jgi:PmbA protein
MPESPLEIAEQALAAASGDEAEAVVQAERSGLARFAGAEVHQPTLIENVVVALTVTRDGRAGVATGNRVDADGIADLGRRAGEAADSASPDPDRPSLAPAAAFPEVEGFDEETASLGPERQAQLAAAAIGAAAGFPVYGYFTSSDCELAVAASTGLRAHQRSTDATVLVLAADEDASGYHERTSWKASQLDPAAVARESVGLARRTRGAQELEPRGYAAVLEPFAIAELLDYFGWDSFNGLGLLEERSYLAGRLGERVMDEKVSISDDALDPRGLPKAFDFEGVPKQVVRLVEGGVARGVLWDRATAARAGEGRDSTGHALPATARKWGAAATSLTVEPGEAESAEALAELVHDGIYVTRIHYPGIVDPREGVITGMTRDGTFRIRGGKIAEPLVNLRFTVSVPELLAEVPGLTRRRLLVSTSDFYDERYPTAALVPAIATARFNVTGSGSGPGI